MEILRTKTISPKGALKRDIIINTAKSILALEGYENFTLRKIALRCSVSLAAVQHYFPSKELLLNAVIEHEVVSYDDHWKRIRKKNGLPKEQLKEFLILILDLHLNKETSGFIFQFWALASTQPQVHFKMQQFYADFLHKLDQALQEQNPHLPIDVINKNSLLIASIIEGTMVFIGGDVRVTDRVKNVRENALELSLSLMG